MRQLNILIMIASYCGFVVPLASALTASQRVEKEIVTVNPDGSETLQRLPADTVLPGERIVYMLDYHNDLEKPASDLVLTMPVPPEVKFIDGTAEKPGVSVSYSADRGQSFALRQVLTTQAEDGRWVPAGAEDITHIRWLVSGPVEAGESGQLVFKGVLK